MAVPEYHKRKINYVVKCVNAHEDLIEALRTVADGINTVFDNQAYWSGEERDKHLQGLQWIASEALKKAGAL